MHLKLTAGAPACATLNGIAAELTLRHRSAQFQWDINYTYSKSIDIGSKAERIDSTGPGFWDQVINSWYPNQLRGPSDFDATHQVNSNWVWNLPVGRDQRFGSGIGPLANAVLGGWQLAGLFRWTSGFPYSAHNGLAFTTDWENSGFAELAGKLPRTGRFTDSDGDPNIFQNSAEALSAFRFPHPGESGVRNNLRGQGFFGVDVGLTKTWKFAESRALQFNWNIYNATNTPRFGLSASTGGPTGAVGFLDIPGSFGKYNQTLNKPRIMEFGLRYSF